MPDNRLKRAWTKAFDKTTKEKYVLGRLGSVDPITNAVAFDAPGRPGYTLVRIVSGSDQGTTIAAYNQGVALKYDAPVKIYYDPTDGQPKIVGVDPVLAQAYAGPGGSPLSGVAPHTHTINSGLEYYEDARLILPGLCTPSASGGLTIIVNGFKYIYNGVRATYDGLPTLDLTPYVTGTAGDHNWALIGVDPVTNLIDVEVSAGVPIAVPLTNAALDAITFTNKIPLAAVQLTNGLTTGATYQIDFTDCRVWNTGIGGSNPATIIGLTNGGTGSNLSATGPGYLIQATNAADVTILKSNLTAVIAPVVGNDNTQGYAIGSQWIDTVAKVEYVCLNASTGAAVWDSTTGSGSGEFFSIQSDGGQFTVGTAYIAFGDSITVGYGASSPAVDYVNLLAADKNWTVTNNAVLGDCAADQAAPIYATTITASSISTYMLGTNDQRTYTTTGLHADFQTMQLAELAWLGIPNVNKILGSNTGLVTYVGTWNAMGVWGGIGKYSDTNGDTATFSVYGENILINSFAYASDLGNGGTFSVTIDGVLYGNYANSFNGIMDTVVHGVEYGPFIIIIPNLTEAQHTVVITVTSATSSSNHAFFTWAGSVRGTQRLSGPYVYVSNVIRMTAAGYVANGGSDANVTAFNTIIRANASLLANIGLNVAMVDNVNLIDPATDLGADGVHPNDAGYALLANGFETATNSVAYAKDRQSSAYPLVAYQDMQLVKTPSSPAATVERVFIDTADGHLKRIDSTGTVVDIEGGAAGFAPANASYITKVSESGLSNEFALGSLATGLLKNTATTGIPTIAAAGTDYVASVSVTAPITNTGTAANPNIGLTTPLSVNFGGTHLATLTDKAFIVGAGTGDPTFLSPSTNRNVAISDGTNWTSRALVDADIPDILTITKIANLTSNGPVKTSGGDGTLGVSAIDLSGAEATGILAATRFPALTGDVTTVAGALATTLANTAVTPASYTYASITVDSKGRVTAASSGAAPTGTVTSVTMTVPAAILSVSGSPITTSGTLAVTLATQTANFIWAGPTTGSAATPTFRALVAADIPAAYIASPLTTKGDLWTYSTVDAKLTIGANNTVLVADSTQTTGNKWSATLAGLTLTTPTISDLTNATHNHQNAAGGGSLDAAAIGSGTLANARVNWASPSAIGTGTPAAGTFTAIAGTTYTGTGLSTITVTDTVTAGGTKVLTIGHNSSLTVASNFSTIIAVNAQTSTTADSQLGQIEFIWKNATHASRFSSINFYAQDSTGQQLVLTTGVNASGKILGFFGNTAVNQPTNTTAINDLLVNLGLWASGGASKFSSVVIAPVGTTSNEPLRFQAGALRTSPGAGAVEFVSNDYYYTITKNTQRFFIPGRVGGTVGSGTVALTAQTASIATTNIIATANMINEGDYLALVILTDTTASTSGGTVLCSILYTDENGAQTDSTTTLLLSATGKLATLIPFHAKTSAGIQYSTTVGGVIVGSPTYSLYIDLIRVS